VRERIATAVRLRLVSSPAHKEAARRAAAFSHASTACGNGHEASLTARSTRIWRGIGDTSTDFNFYTKRAILAAVYPRR